jgi:type IV pilus assembly protein PilM
MIGGIFSKSIVGLDIGTSSIKALEMHPNGAKWTLDKAAWADLPKEALEAAKPEARQGFVLETLRRLMKENGIKSRNVVTSLSGDSVIVRYVKLPFMSAEELRGAIATEAEQYIPLNIDQVILDFQILGEAQEEGQKKLDVLLVAAKIDAVDQHISLLKQAGLTPRIIDVDAFALQNAFDANRAETGEETVALLNIGASLTTLNVIEGNQTRFTRDITVAGNDFTREVQKEFNLRFSEAEELKKAQGSISMEEDDLGLGSMAEKDDRVLRMSDAMMPVLNKLLGEMRRSFDFYETQSRKKTVERIALTGGTARLKNLNRFLANKLGIPVEYMAPFRNIEMGHGLDVERITEQDCRLGVCLGLAMRRTV